MLSNQEAVTGTLNLLELPGTPLLREVPRCGGGSECPMVQAAGTQEVEFWKVTPSTRCARVLSLLLPWFSSLVLGYHLGVSVATPTQPPADVPRGGQTTSDKCSGPHAPEGDPSGAPGLAQLKE